MRQYDKKIKNSMVALLTSIAVTVVTVVISYIVVYGSSGAKLIANKHKKANSYASANSNVKQGETVFFGDSITEMCNLEKYYPNVKAHNRGISGDTSLGMLERLQSNVIDIAPSTLIIMGGTNDIGRNITPAEIAQNINSILQKTRQALPDCNIFVESVYPVNAIRKPTFLNKVGTRTNQAIDELNALLPDICANNGCVYIDVNSQLKDEKGNLKDSYTKDGLHLTDEAYQQVAKIVAPYIANTQV